MHELTLARELMRIIDEVATAHGARRVRAATLQVGALSCVEPHALDFAFELVSRGTLAAGCKLQVERVPLAVRCASCGHSGPATLESPGCPACGAVPVEVIAGRELRLVAIETEDERDA